MPSLITRSSEPSLQTSKKRCSSCAARWTHCSRGLSSRPSKTAVQMGRCLCKFSGNSYRTRSKASSAETPPEIATDGPLAAGFPHSVPARRDSGRNDNTGTMRCGGHFHWRQRPPRRQFNWRPLPPRCQFNWRPLLPLVISTGGRRPGWRNLAATKAFSPGTTELPSNAVTSKPVAASSGPSKRAALCDGAAPRLWYNVPTVYLLGRGDLYFPGSGLLGFPDFHRQYQVGRGGPIRHSPGRRGSTVIGRLQATEPIKRRTSSATLTFRHEPAIILCTAKQSALWVRIKTQALRHLPLGAWCTGRWGSVEFDKEWFEEPADLSARSHLRGARRRACFSPTQAIQRVGRLMWNRHKDLRNGPFRRR